MEKHQKIDYFNKNLNEIFHVDSQSQLFFLSECITDKRTVELLKKWPDEIKLSIIDKYFESV